MVEGALHEGTLWIKGWREERRQHILGTTRATSSTIKATITTTAIAGVIFQANIKCQARAKCFALSSLQLPQPYK